MKHLQNFLELAKAITDKVGNRHLNTRLNKSVRLNSIPNANGCYVIVEFGDDMSEKGSLSFLSSSFSGVSISCKVKEDASLFIDELWEELQLDVELVLGLLDTQIESLVSKEREDLLAQQERIAKQLETLNK